MIRFTFFFLAIHLSFTRRHKYSNLDLQHWETSSSSVNIVTAWKRVFFLKLCEHQGEGYNECRPQMHMFRAAVHQLLELIDNYSWRRLSSEEKAPPDDFGDGVVRATLLLDMLYDSLLIKHI